MSSINHSRGHDRILDNGPRWESKDPSAGCNSTHVARARRKWKRLHERNSRRSERHSLMDYVRFETTPLKDNAIEEALNEHDSEFPTDKFGLPPNFT